jgi:hypothetical protein
MRPSGVNPLIVAVRMARRRHALQLADDLAAQRPEGYSDVIVRRRGL